MGTYTSSSGSKRWLGLWPLSVEEGDNCLVKLLGLLQIRQVPAAAFGSSTSDIRDSVVVDQNGRITGVGTPRATKIPRGAEVIDATGKFIVPGLHDVFATIDNQAYANAFQR